MVHLYQLQNITFDRKEGDDNMEQDLSYVGYQLIWEDTFDGDSLNLDDWNIEVHEPGWVNSELQEYTTSPANTYVKDGMLVLKPIKAMDDSGKVSYTSGRVSTQYKHDFTYGIFEARLRVPAGKGFLPAFWLMTTSEEQHGQWPRCGEIDIMEILGHDTRTNYGTIHYGIPHQQKQGMCTLDTGSFSEEFHTFALKWEPGRLSWYVDGKCFFAESEWYSVSEVDGKRPYPAPFNHDFYIILNLAVGGSWPGDPDETTDIDNSVYEIDYVKVYQKKS